jgi:low temperature requirement protein LtrA
MTGGTRGPFKRWLSSPPRPHGEIIEDRTVSFLELFYDLAYVAVITQVAHRLTEDISVQGIIEFAVVFSMLAAGAGVALLAGSLAPAPWILALMLVAVLTALWFFAVASLIRAGAWGEPVPETAEPA